MMMGGTRRPLLPSKPWISLPQIPQAWTRISASSSPTSGSGMSVTLSFLYSSSNKAFMGGILR